jgi:hypothetical protein
MMLCVFLSCLVITGTGVHPPAMHPFVNLRFPRDLTGPGSPVQVALQACWGLSTVCGAPGPSAPTRSAQSPIFIQPRSLVSDLHLPVVRALSPQDSWPPAEHTLHSQTRKAALVTTQSRLSPMRSTYPTFPPTPSHSPIHRLPALPTCFNLLQ